jgi:histidine ammonia-lyase
MKTLTIDGKGLTLEQVEFVARSNSKQVKVEISTSAFEKIIESNSYVQELVKRGNAVYGINTGFGALSDVKIEEKNLVQLQINLVRSHCTGVGTDYNEEISRAVLLLRANCLCSGFSGVSPSSINLIIEMLNNDIYPAIPQKGSVGASGDLAPLAHMALSLIGEGHVYFQGSKVPTMEAFDKVKLHPVQLGPKDGLALINGTTVMTALGVLAVRRAQKLATLADVAACITNEAVRGTKAAYDKNISLLKPHPGQLETVSNLNLLLADSEIRKSHTECDRVQDPYSLRCVPQVHGASRQTLRHAAEVFNIEINSVTDNPLVFPEENRVISGGNFHGQAISFCMDYLAMGLAEFCSISERRIEKMMNPVFSDLPHFLTKNSGLNSGLMIAHVTVAALVSENKIYCHPASVDSVPTSTDKEDHVSMGITAGLKLHTILENLETTLAIEFLCNTQALEFLRPLTSNKAIEAVYTLIRKYVPPIEEDRVFAYDIEKIRNLVRDDDILKVLKTEIGELI